MSAAPSVEEAAIDNDVSRRVTAVITTYNSAHVIRATLEAIPTGVHVIVVDNASRDQTVTLVRGARPQAKIYAQALNVGFGPGCNVGLADVTTEFAVVINPDLVVAPTAIARCLAAADQMPDAAIVGCRQRDAQAAALAPASDAAVSDVESLSGAFMFMRIALVRPLGFFDPNLFLYFEDSDLNLRVRLAGHRLIEVAAARVQHLGGKSTATSHDSQLEKMRIWGQSCAYFAEKHKDHPIGQRVARKVRSYTRRARIKRLLCQFDAAAELEARIQGFKEYQAGGVATLRDNLFARR
ncbi:MAG: glycosyltransferase family 2 protein [Pseudomonadota bacterium]